MKDSASPLRHWYVCILCTQPGQRGRSTTPQELQDTTPTEQVGTPSSGREGGGRVALYILRTHFVFSVTLVMERGLFRLIVEPASHTGANHGQF